MPKRSKKKAAGRRRRKRNPRALAAGRPGRAPTPKEVIAAVHEALLQSRATLQSAETEARLGAPLKDYFLLVVTTLEDMLKMALVDSDDLQLFAQAAATFMPVLGMKWLPEDPRSSARELTEEEQELLEKMRGGGDGSQPTGRWHGLLNLLAESAAVFIGFGYWDGLVQCYALNEALIARLGGPPPEPLEE